MSTTGVEGVRRANLARILGLVHLAGPRSRAALTDETGLNRSTVADLVGELVGLGLVAEHSPDPSHRVGRPSPIVAVDGRVVAIAANPEVDALEIAAVGLDQGLIARERIVVDHLLTPAETADLIADQVARWREGVLGGARLVGVGVAVPGLVRTSDGLVRNAPHLLWHDAPVRDLVTAATGLPAVVGNDATLGAVAEHLFGAARGIDDVVYLNGGASGIGGGVIVHGRPVEGASGYAGEFGQNRPGIATLADRRARDGALEDEVSRARLLSAVGMVGGDDASLAAAIEEADAPDATAEVARQRRILATAIANAVNVLNPSVIVLGGFLATLAAPDLDGFVTHVAAQSWAESADDLVVRVASLGDDRLLIGAAEAAFGALLADPSSAGASGSTASTSTA